MTRAATSSRSCSNPAEASARVSWAAVSYEAPSLFQQPQDEPLAARMRPRNLDEFIGQDHILGEGRLLRRAIQADQLSSLIFYGPPGTGKTTLARVIAGSTRAKFIAINAVLGGVKDIREAVAEASSARRMGQRTILFVDEVHRFNKAQQDALLPWVENGTVILIGATTENPYFEVNKALVSRSRIFQLKPLSEDDLRRVAEQALADPERGFGSTAVNLHADALDHLVNVANGDARAILNALELAVLTTEPDDAGVRQLTPEVAEESIQQRAVRYDKEGDAHFDTVSAFIKSMRGSDPDAALYWLARMLYAGEDARFILRRLLIFASEDVGLADPAALQHTVAAAQAFDYVGLPEGRWHLSQAVLYLATAPKSNSTMAVFDAVASVEKEREADVPNHLRDASRDAEGFGHGKGYLYPHAYRDHWVAQQYLPENLQGKVFYEPGSLGFEKELRAQVLRRREAQLAAMLEQDAPVHQEVLTGSPADPQRDRWLERTVSEAGGRLGELRDALMELAGLQRHELVLDLQAGSGLLTWEALRRTPEGQVWAVAARAEDARALGQQARQLAGLERPVVLQADTEQAAAAVGRENPEQRFDVVLGRNVLTPLTESAAGDLLGSLAPLLTADGRLVLAEQLPGDAQRLYRIPETVPAGLLERWTAAEEAVYAELDLPWSEGTLLRVLGQAGFRAGRQRTLDLTSRRQLGQAALLRWFPAGPAADSYAARLTATGLLRDGDLGEMERLLRERAARRPVSWTQRLVLLRAGRDSG